MPLRLFALSPSHAVRRSSLAAAAVLALMLGACGGSDDAPVAPPPPPPPVGSAPVITTQPTDMSLAEGGSGSVSVAATSDAGAIAYQWFNATSAANIAGANAAALDFGPVSFAANGTQFNARLTNTMGTTTSATRTLTVAERTWATPTDVFLRSRQLATAVDSNGHTHILAITGNNLFAGVEAVIQLRASNPTQANAFIAPGNSALQEPEALAAGGTSVAAAANGAGNVLAVWHRNGIVGGALYTPGPDAATAGTWALLPTRINSMSATSALQPAVAAVGNNSFEIVWRERIANSGAHDLMARSYTVGNNTLGTPVTIEQDSTETEAPQLVADGAGNLLAAWRHVGVGTVVNRRAAGQAWGTSVVTVDPSTQPLEVLRTNAAGKAVLLTSNRIGTVFASRLDLAAIDVLLAGPASVANAYGSGPDAMVDNSNRIHVIGVSCCGSGGSSRVFRWVYENSWSSAEAISEANTNDFLTTGLGFYSPRISAVDAEGNYIVTWQDRIASGDDALSRVIARRFHTPLNTWRPAVVVGDSDNGLVQVAMKANGSATLTFGASTVARTQAVSFR